MLELCVGTSVVLVLFHFLVEPGLIKISDLVEESVTVNRELIDDLLDDWLYLHESVDSTANLLIQDLEHDPQELVDRHFTCGLVIQELHHESDVLQGNLLGDIVNDLSELSTREVARLIDVHALVKLLDREPSTIYRVTDRLHDCEDLLKVRCSLLGLVLLLDHGLLEN